MSTSSDTPPPRSTVAQRLLAGGDEPDPRFTLANERTFLAWIRTSLALLAGGVAVEAFTGALFDEMTRRVLGSILLVLAAVIAFSAVFRWIRVERAMRRGRALPLPVLAPLLALGTAMAAAVVFIMVMV
ncbi:MAG: YidH family protein [Micrococcaceae bacterium]